MDTPKPFDPKDPSTWPKLNPKQLAEMQAKAGYKPLTGKKPTGTPVQPDTNMYNAGLGDVLRGAGNAFVKAGDFVFKEPAKSAMRTLSTQNIQTALNPRSSATQRINAVGEDVLNVASIVPGVRAVRRFSDDAIRSLSRAKANLNTKMIPTASLDNYILHGGPPIEKLQGGVLDPDFVRGGELYTGRIGTGNSTLVGPNGLNQTERNFILSTAAENPKYAERHSEIIKRIKAGEEHQTGVGKLKPGDTYAHAGGNYVLDIPQNLRTSETNAPIGEIKFWGKQRPAGFVKQNKNTELFNKATMQVMIDDADIKAGQTQKLANMLARARGTKITPAYKSLVEETFNKFLNKSYRPFYENPDYRGAGLQYFEDYTKQPVPYVQNYNEAIAAVRNAKTEKEIFNIIDTLVPSEGVDIALKQAFNNSTELGFPDLKNRVINFMSGINPEYSRLRNVPRGGPIVVNEIPYPENLVNWEPLRSRGPSDKMFAFAQRFMDRRTPAEVIQQVYDDELYSLMLKNPKEGQKILNERLANLNNR
jgi:hypothetical protein